jgi:cytochrome c oxidase assembly protein subunit 15
MPQVGTRSARGETLALGFGISAAMWFFGYVCRLPFVSAPAWLAASGLLALLAGGGVVAGRLGTRGAVSGAFGGLLAAAINMLVLGSLLTGQGRNELVPSALLWLPGSLLLGVALGWLGARAGAATKEGEPREVSWTHAFALVVLVATFLQIVVGGMVTSSASGLAVVDWPNSFGSNMFLLPLARMTGGIYYEHAHRLFGALVGLATLALALHLWHVEPRRRVRQLGGLAAVLVVAQGILGGLRVTGRFTLATAPEAVAPNLTLAAVHGVLGPIFLAVVVCLFVVTDPAWAATRTASPPPRAGGARALTTSLMLVLVVQLALGAVQRHFARGLPLHVALAVVVLTLAVLTSRALAQRDAAPVSGAGAAMLVAGAQAALGVLALAAVTARIPGAPRPLWQVGLTTAHQAVGSLLLALAVALWLRTRRLLAASL